VRARIENIYALQGFDSIDKQDLRGRMRWWGLYTQRSPGTTAHGPATRKPTCSRTRTQAAVRCDGGAAVRIRTAHAGPESPPVARDTADISDGENVQYHWIEIEKCRRLWKRLDAVAWQTTEACGDCPAWCSAHR